MPEIEEFDFDKFDQEFEAAYKEEETAPEGADSEDELVETEEDPESEETPDAEGLETGDENLEASKNTDLNSDDETKRNAAFAQLRRERDEAKRVADWLAQVAQQNGTTPEEMMKNYQEAQLQKESQEKGVPVDVLQRLQAIENENAMLKNATFEERFNAQVEQTISTYGATEQDVEKAFAYAQENGLVEIVRDGKMTFDALYKLAHLDTLTERKVQEEIQKGLSQKKKRQQEAPIGVGSVASQTEESLEDQAVRDAKELIQNGGF